MSIVPSPPLHKHVFCKALRDTPAFLLGDDAGAVQLRLQQGDLYILPYAPIAGFLEAGSVTLMWLLHMTPNNNEKKIIEIYIKDNFI